MPPRFRLLLLSLALLWGLSAPAQAEVWIGLDKAHIYSFTGEKRDIYDLGVEAGVTADGAAVYVSLPLLPGLGYEKYSIQFLGDADHHSTDASIQLFDVFLDFSGKSANFLVGYGKGKALLSCQSTSCAEYQFEEGDAQTYLLQVGVPLEGNWDFHLSGHAINALVPVINPEGQEANLDFSGLVFSFGLRAGF